MLSTPWSLGFVLAVILGAMLVPGCRPQNGLSSQYGSSQAAPSQYVVAIKGTSAGRCRGVEVGDRSETRPAAPCPTESAYRQRP
jgi:hypothetical protein